MSMKRRQHILPESYLINWVDPATTRPNRTPMVWTFTKDLKTRHARPPAAGYFWRDYFYDLVSDSGEHCQKLEDLLGRIEGAVAAVTRNCITRNQPLKLEEGASLDLFVACMFMRTEKMRGSIVSGANAFARIEREHALTHGARAPDTTIRQRNAHAHAIYDGVLLISDYLGKMSHNVFIAPAGKTYLTSDTPCLWQAAWGQPCLENPTFEVSLPLTPQHMLHISRLTDGSAYGEASGFLVDQTNWDMIRACHQYFISNSQQADPCWQEDGSHRLRALLEGAALTA
jgi:hypothetical protein